MQTPVMEEQISGAIVRSFFAKFERHLAVDVALVGAGPSALVAARDLAKAGFKVALYESKLAPGGGTWGGGMLMNEVVVQDDAAAILHEFDIGTAPVGGGYHTVDSVEMASGLIFGARKAGAVIFNSVCVEDVVVHDGVVCGVVINWNPVRRLDMHVDRRMNDRMSGARFQPGWHHFVGGEALAYARNRNDVPYGDFSRSENQGALLLAWLATCSTRRCSGSSTWA